MVSSYLFLDSVWSRSIFTHDRGASSPTLVANLWDVTDKDIDKFSQSVFDKLSLNSMKEKRTGNNNNTSIVAAVAQSRDSCKLKYLTGAAPVVYGIPFYL